MKIIGIILFIVIVTILLIAGYHGAFHKVVVTYGNTNTMWLAYDKFIGPYQKTGPVSDKIYYDLLKKDSVETYKGFGIYYDNPKEINPEECRSVIGCIMEEKDYSKIEDLKSKYNIVKIEGSKAIISQFPYNGKLSIIFGILKAHKVIEKFRNEKGIDTSPLMEIYNVPKKKIEYIAAPKVAFKDFDQFQ